MGRWFRFFIAILIGIGAGLLYGWVINPIEYIDTSPDSLGIDYKADFVLMTAEAYHADGDLNAASERLAILGDTPPSVIVQQAILFAERVGYSDADLSLMHALNNALLNDTPGQETPAS
jgi:hypothetical protein